MGEQIFRGEPFLLQQRKAETGLVVGVLEVLKRLHLSAVLDGHQHSDVLVDARLVQNSSPSGVLLEDCFAVRGEDVDEFFEIY